MEIIEIDVYVYVIDWYYYDRSDSGVMPYAYANKAEAQRALHMLQEHGSRQYELRELKLLGA
jgi:hypothetical protein